MSIIEDIKDKVQLRVEEIVKEDGVQLIDFKFFSLRGRYTLRCLVDYPSGGITVSDCARLNTRIVSFLDDSHLLGEDFIIEVNSPGLDRRLIARDDFLRLKGKSICLWLSESCEGKDYLEAELIDVGNDNLILKYEGKELILNLNKVRVGKVKISI